MMSDTGVTEELMGNPAVRWFISHQWKDLIQKGGLTTGYRRSLAMRNPSLLLLLLITTSSVAVEVAAATEAGSAPTEIYVGAVYGAGNQNAYKALELAVQYINGRRDVLPQTRIRLRRSRNDDIRTRFEYITQTCYLVEQNVLAIIGPQLSNSVKPTVAITESLHIPQITAFATDATLSLSATDYPYLIKLSPPDTFQARALAALGNHFRWTKYAIIASIGDYGRNGVQDFQTQAANFNWLVPSLIYFYPPIDPSQIDVTEDLKSIRDKGLRIILLWSLARYAKVILDQARKLGMTSSEYAWLMTDGITVWPEDFYPPCEPAPEHVQGLLGTRPSSGQGPLFPVFMHLWNATTPNSSFVDYSDAIKGVEAVQEAFSQWDTIKSSFDALLVVAYGLHEYLADGHSLTLPTFGQSICSSNETTAPWPDGEKLMKYMSKIDRPGVSGRLKFNNRRYPEEIHYDIVNIQKTGFVQVGTWSENDDPHLQLDNTTIQFMGDVKKAPLDVSLDLSLAFFKVVTIIERPYAMKSTVEERRLNPSVEYVGFCIELLNQLRDDLGFAYELSLVESYGSKETRNNTEIWTGVIGELVYSRADMAIGSLSITYERQQVIDFTTPYQDLGLSILLAKEVPSNNMFSFLQPFEWKLWIAVGGAFVFCAMATSFCSYISPFGYRGRYIQRHEAADQRHREERNNMRLIDSLWFSFASWMQQGPDVIPRCLSGRLVHGFWWFAVMVITATYTANLAAFLTVQRLEQGINSVEDLAKQTEIEYGTVASSAASDFFTSSKESPYSNMHGYILSHNSNVADAQEGIQKVNASHGKPKSEQYAFIWDSAPLDYAANQEPCNVLVVQKLFNKFGYGLAFRKNSPYTDVFSLKLLYYRQNGYLDALYIKWFGGTCSLADTGSTTTKGDTASIKSMSGVFILLVVGLVASFFSLLAECMIATYKDHRFFRRTKDGPQDLKGCAARRIKLVLNDLKKIYCSHCTCEDVSYEVDSGEGPYRGEMQDKQKSPDVLRNGQAENGQESISNGKFEFLDMIHGRHINTSVRRPSLMATGSTMM